MSPIPNIRNPEATMSPNEPSEPEGRYPLGQALLHLTDPGLAKEFTDAKRELNVARQFWAGWRPPGYEGPMIGLDPLSRELQEPMLRERVTRANAAITNDFRTRLQDGRIVLTGLKVQPQLDNHPTCLSPTWAPHMEFNWQEHAIRVFDVKFVNVKAVASAPGPCTEPPMPLPKAAAPRGRPRFPMTDFVNIVASNTWCRAASQKQEATALLDEYRKRHSHGTVPSYRTVLSRIAEIYLAAAEAAAPDKAQKSI